MNQRTTYILFGLVLVALGGFALLVFLKKSPDLETWLLPELHEKGKSEVKSSEIDAVELERHLPGGATDVIAFKRVDGTWQMEKPSSLRIQPTQVDRLVSELIDARREKSEISTNLEELGLNPPAVVVTIHKGDQSWTVNLSKQPSKLGAETVVYATTSTNPKQPTAVRQSAVSAAYQSVAEFRARELISGSALTTTGLKLKTGSGTEVAWEKSSDGSWRFTNPPYGPANFEGDTPPAPPFGAPPPANTKEINGVKQVIDAVGQLRVELDSDFIADNVSDADLASKYGLEKDKPATLRIVLTSTQPGDKDKAPVSDVLLIGKKVEPEKKEGDKPDEKKEGDKPGDKKPEYYYARLGSESSVVRVPAAKIEPLLTAAANPDAFRDRRLVNAEGSRKDRIDAINLQDSHGKVFVRLRKGEGAFNPWKVYRDGSPAANADPATMQRLIDALIENRKSATFVDKEDGLDLNNPSAVVTVWIDGQVHEEKKEDKKDEKKDEKPEEKKEDKEPALKDVAKPTVTLTFGKREKDKGIVYVRRELGGTKSVLQISDGIFDLVTQGPLAFLDRKLPTFAQAMKMDDVSKIVLNREGKEWVLNKEKVGEKESVWKFAKPDAFAGRKANANAVERLIAELASLRAEKLIAEKPPESELDTLYGLKSPQTSATLTVTKDGKSEDWTYSFGKDTNDSKDRVYAKMSRSDLVFSVNKNTIGGLQADLRDPTVFAFDAAKAKGVKITTWSEDSGAPLTLDLERKGPAEWVAKSGPQNIDSGKVESILFQLGQLKAQNFVTPKAGTDPALDVNKKALKFEITVEGEKDPLELIIGADDPDHPESLFAKSSSLKDEIFDVQKSMFDPAKKPGYYRKH
jgi:hypothetical protein